MSLQKGELSAMSTKLLSRLGVAFLFLLLTPPASGQSLPPEGTCNDNVCNRVEHDQDGRLTLEEKWMLGGPYRIKIGIKYTYRYDGDGRLTHRDGTIWNINGVVEFVSDFSVASTVSVTSEAEVTTRTLKTLAGTLVSKTRNRFAANLAVDADGERRTYYVSQFLEYWDSQGLARESYASLERDRTTFQLMSAHAHEHNIRTNRRTRVVASWRLGKLDRISIDENGNLTSWDTSQGPFADLPAERRQYFRRWVLWAAGSLLADDEHGELLRD